MDQYSPLGCFIQEWTCYLELHGHRVRRAGRSDVLLSRNGRGLRYRWLLRSADEYWIALHAAERKTIRSQARLARKAGEQCYVVVNFGYPRGTAIAVPAAKAVSARLLFSWWGAIPLDC